MGIKRFSPPSTRALTRQRLRDGVYYGKRPRRCGAGLPLLPPSDTLNLSIPTAGTIELRTSTRPQPIASSHTAASSKTHLFKSRLNHAATHSPLCRSHLSRLAAFGSSFGRKSTITSSSWVRGASLCFGRGTHRLDVVALSSLGCVSQLSISRTCHVYYSIHMFEQTTLDKCPMGLLAGPLVF